MTTITCKIPEHLDAELEALARRERVSKSKIVREAVEQRVKRSAQRAAPRAYDLLKPVIGSLRGPADLSTNPRYLEDLGA